MEKINPEDHAALMYEVNQMQHDKAHQIAADLQMYLHKYQELLLDLDDTVRNYKETARKIRGGE
jgi:hypothetical protein